MFEVEFGATDTWLVSPIPKGLVRVRVLARDVVSFSWARHSTLTVPLHPGVEMGTGEFNTGGNLAMDQHPIQKK